jgi:branched-chain amino acid transport system substrate-binding protein
MPSNEKICTSAREDTMRRTFHRAAVILSGLVVLPLALQGAAAPANAYDINVILPLTGGASFLGKEEEKALQLAETSINKAGGIKGEPLHFIFYDDQSNPQTGVQLTNRVVAAKPAVVLGSSLVAICNAMAPLMQNGPAMYCFSPGIHPPKGSYVFTASVSTLDLADALVRHFRLKGWTRLAFMTSADATGQDAERGLNEVVGRPENKDITVVERAHFNTTDVSVAAQIEHIKAADPQALIAWSTGTPIATVFKGIVQAGLDIPVATTNGNMTYAQMTQYAAFLPKQLYIPTAEWVQHAGIITLDPAVETAQQQFFDIFKAADAKPDLGATIAWDPAMIVIDALRHLGPDATAQQVRDYIANLKGFAGINGVYDFPKNPQRGLDVQGAIVTLWNPARQTWELVSKPTGVPLGN